MQTDIVHKLTLGGHMLRCVPPVSVTETTADCYTTVAEVCPYKKPSSLCPR